MPNPFVTRRVREKLLDAQNYYAEKMEQYTKFAEAHAEKVRDAQATADGYAVLHQMVTEALKQEPVSD